MDTRAPDRKKSFLSGAFFLFLSNLFHKTAHSGGCLVLLLASGVGVGAQGETGVEVAQHEGYCFHIHTVLQGRGSEGVPLRYNCDKPEKPRRIKGFEVFSLFFSSFSKPKEQTEKSRIIGGDSLTTKAADGSAHISRPRTGTGMGRTAYHQPMQKLEEERLVSTPGPAGGGPPSGGGSTRVGRRILAGTDPASPRQIPPGNLPAIL